MVNKVILIGNLGKDPEIRRLENGAVVAKFSVATNENYKDKAGEWQTQTEWHDVVVWRAHAERAEQQLKKGSQIYLEGKLTHRSWEGTDGIKRYTTEVVGSYFRNLTRKEGDGGNFGGNFPSANDEAATATFTQPATAPAPKATTPAAPTANAGGTESEDDLPF